MYVDILSKILTNKIAWNCKQSTYSNNLRRDDGIKQQMLHIIQTLTSKYNVSIKMMIKIWLSYSIDISFMYGRGSIYFTTAFFCMEKHPIKHVY